MQDQTQRDSRIPGLKWILVLGILLVPVYLYLDLNGILSRKNLLTIATPAHVQSFEVQDASGTVLWRLTSFPPIALSRIAYGVVPRGFIQEVPSPANRPRPFVDGEALKIVTITPERRFTHDGQAWGGGGFRGGGWLSEPFKRP